MLEPDQGRPSHCGSVRNPLRDCTNLEAYKIGLVATSTAAMIASAVSRSSSANFEARRHCQRDHSAWPSACVGAAPRLPWRQRLRSAGSRTQAFAWNSSQVVPLGFAIFAELRGSERRSLSLRRQHNLRHRRLRCPGQRRSHRCGSPATAKRNKRELRRLRSIRVPGVPPLAMGVDDPIYHPHGWSRDGLNGR